MNGRLRLARGTIVIRSTALQANVVSRKEVCQSLTVLIPVIRFADLWLYSTTKEVFENCPSDL